MKSIPWYAEGGWGKLGDTVYYRRWGKTYARKAPGSYNVIPTEKQQVMRERFIAAHKFAQSIISDPILKALYELKGKGKRMAYSVAMSEFMKGGDQG